VCVCVCVCSVSRIHRKASGEVTNECLIISLHSSARQEGCRFSWTCECEVFGRRW
jgi:hypothetical protein